MPEKPKKAKALKLLDTPEAREIYEKALAKWHERLKPLTDACRRAQQISGEDLNIRVGPCSELLDREAK